MADPLRHHLRDEVGHDAGVIFIAAGPGQVDGGQRQAHALGLCQQQLLAHPVHGHPFERLVEGGEQSHHLDGRILPQCVQRPGAVLAAAPGEQHLGLHMISPAILRSEPARRRPSSRLFAPADEPGA